MKNGKEVPNCVPVTEELGKDSEWGTPELTKKMMKKFFIETIGGFYGLENAVHTENSELTPKQSD